MTENSVIFRDDVTVELVDMMGDESNIVRAARVSTKGAYSKNAQADKGLLRYLYREAHGVPFESVIFQFYIEVPIFVSRQIVKHRITSINEESGRYKELRPMFYIPNRERLLVQEGKTGDYNFVPGNPMQYAALEFVLRRTAEVSWDNYQALLENGIAKEVARMHLPLNTYSSMYYTCNLRSLLNFLSLRKNWGEDAVHQSKAQHEIELVAEKMSDIVAEKLPTVWDAFIKNGYLKV